MLNRKVSASKSATILILDRCTQAENRTIIDKKSDNNNPNSELINSDWCSCWTRLRNNGNV